MLRSLKSGSFYLILFVLFFFLYLRENLVSDATKDLNKSNSYLVFIYLAGIVLTVVFFFIKQQKGKHLKEDGFLVYYSSIFVVFSFLSFFWSAVYPTPITVSIVLLTPLFVVYISYYSIIQTKNDTLFHYLVIIGFFALCVTYFQYAQLKVILAAFGDENLSSSYYILYVLPIILAFKKKYLSSISLILTLIILVLSNKRAGTIAFIIACLVYLIVCFLVENKNKRSVFKNVFFICVMAGCFFYFAADYVSFTDLPIIERMQRVETGAQDESRYEIWMITNKLIGDSNLFQYLFGHGFNAVLRDNPMKYSAHNDFLEIMYDFGLFVLIAYIILHIKLYKKSVELVKSKSKYAAAFIFSVVVFELNSMVSHIIIYPYHAMTFAFVWGCILGMKKKNNLLRVNI